MRASKSFYPLLLLISWTGLVAGGTFVLLQTTVRQDLARKYSTIQGKIVRSAVGRGAYIRRGVEIEYSYTVNGIIYTGHRYRYDDHNAVLEWDETVEDNPRGSMQTVYYDPKNPADSLLEPGVDGCDLLLLLFTLPMNVLTFVFWRATISRWREESQLPPAAGVKILNQPESIRIRLAEVSPLAAAFYGMAGAAFIAAFPVVAAGGFEPTLHLMTLTWAFVAATGVLAGLWRAIRNSSGIYDLCLDKSVQTVTLPRIAGRRRPLTIARSEISGVSLQKRVSKGPSGKHFSFLPALNRGGLAADMESIELITWGWSEKKARVFSEWLSQELGVKFQGVQEEKPECVAKG